MKDKIISHVLIFICFFTSLCALFILGSHFGLSGLKHEIVTKEQDVKNVIVVSNPKEPNPKDGKKKRIVFKEELSLGEVEGDENYMFGQRVYFNVDDNGNFYVTDWDRKTIKKFNPEGEFLLTIGRPGEGPGEFQNIWGPWFDRENNLYVLDIANSRLSFFSKEGELLRQVKVPHLSSVVYINRLGFYVTTKTEIIEEDGVEKSIYVFGLYDKQFNLKAEIFRDFYESKRRSGRSAKSRVQFTADILSESVYQPSMHFILDSHDFIYFGYPEKYEIKKYSPEGKLVKIIKKEHDPIKLNKKHKESYFDEQEEEFFRFISITDDIKKQVKQLIRFPKYLPAYQSFTLMENGWLFVIVEAVRNEYTLVDIFDEECRYIGQFKTTIPSNELLFKNKKAYALATEEGFKLVKRYNFEIQEYKNSPYL